MKSQEEKQIAFVLHHIREEQRAHCISQPFFYLIIRLVDRHMMWGLQGLAEGPLGTNSTRRD
jgi:hypothetical protein